MNPKKSLRRIIQDKRNLLTAEIRAEKSRAAVKRFLSAQDYLKSKTIFIYYPFRSELDTTLIIKKAISDGKKIILPRVSGNKLDLYYIEDIERQLKKGSYGIMEPIPSICRSARISDIDLAVVPGVCFDKNFNRLGYGGGYYDKLLPLLPENVKKIAICFEMQILDEIPICDYDIEVDKIITEFNIYGKINK